MNTSVLPQKERWLIVQLIMEALRPHCVLPAPPPPKAKDGPLVEKPVETVEQIRLKQLPVLFSTKEGRLEVIGIAAKAVWTALRLRERTNVSYELYVKQGGSPVELVSKNLPDMRSYKLDLEDLEDARAAYQLKGTPGAACSLCSPVTRNCWVFDEVGRLEYVQKSAVARWAAYLRDLCRWHADDQGGYWQPPSFEAMGVKEYWNSKGRLMWM